MVKPRVKIKKDGISTFIATLLLMVLAVSAGVVIYAYTMGYLGGFGGPQTMGAISLDTYNFVDATHLQVYVRNIGKSTFQLQSVYIDGLSVPTANFDHITIDENGVKETTITYTFDTLTHTVKLIGVDNTQISFNAKRTGAQTPSTPVLNHFDFDTIGTPQTSGVAFSVTIKAKDQYDAAFISYTGTADLASSVGSIVPTSTPAFTAGVWTGDVTVTGAGSCYLTATDGTPTVPSNTFTVTGPSPVLNHFHVTAVGGGDIGNQVSGTQFSIVITAIDQYGATLTTYTGTNTLTYSGGTIAPTTTAAFVAGVRTEPVTLTGAGTGVTISTAAVSDPTKTGTSNTFDVTTLGSIRVIKDSQPNNAQSFGFTDTGLTPASFSLTDSGGVNYRDFTGLAAGTYTVTESAVTGWSLTGITIVDPTADSTFNLGTRVATLEVGAGEDLTVTFVNKRNSDAQNLIQIPGFETDSTWVESVNNLASDRADRYYNNDQRSGSRDGRTDSRSPTVAGSAYAILTQDLTPTVISSLPDSNSLTVYLFRRNTASNTYPVEVRIYSGSTMLSYIWCTTGQLPSDTTTQKYIRIGDVTSISTSSYSSLVRNLRADWISKGLSTSLQIDRIQLVSTGNRSGTTYYGQDIVWDDLQLLYLP
jgi:hypothetical protein